MYTYQQLRAFGDVIAHLVARELPKHVTFERTVAKRPRGSVLIDVDQNSQGRPLAAAYSVRAFPQATVSAPLLPRELRAGLRADKFNLKTMIARVAEKGDLWADFWKRRQRIEPAVEKLSAHFSRKNLKRQAFAVIVSAAGGRLPRSRQHSQRVSSRGVRQPWADDEDLLWQATMRTAK